MPSDNSRLRDVEIMAGRAFLRNVLIQCAFDGLIEAPWTDDIHDEWMRDPPPTRQHCRLNVWKPRVTR